MKKKAEFDNLTLATKELPEGSRVGYRVYKDAENFVVVPAETAAAALEASGVINAYKIERLQFDKLNVVDKPLTSKTDAVTPEITPEVKTDS